MRKILSIIVMFLPWKLKRFFLTRFWGYEIAPSAYIGWSYIFPGHLVMKQKASIGHFNVAIHLDYLEMGENATISRSNWITGMSTKVKTRFFSHQNDRHAELVMGRDAAITKQHHIDCTDRIMIGDYSTIAGYRSQFLSHSIDLYEGRQDSKPITIGRYCFVATSVIILGGAVLPDYCVLAAGGVLKKQYKEQWCLYGGVPAKKIKDIGHNAKYFNRQKGFCY